MSTRKPKTKTDPLNDREKVFLQIIDELNQLGDHEMRALADAAGCHWGTLYSWRGGHTMAPRIDKIFPVARELGYEIKLFGTGRRRPALRVV